MTKGAHQLNLLLTSASRGGARRGAGRPSQPNAKVLHRNRAPVPRGRPVLVTIKLQSGLPSLRSGRFLRDFRRTLTDCALRPGFRVVHYSVQSNHCHFLIEAAGKVALANGMKSLCARIARCINRVYVRRGPVLHGRYHARVLSSPREVRNALAYVLLNHRRHARRPGPAVVDAASSGVWFDGWADAACDSLENRPREVATPRTWLIRIGWRRHRLIALSEVPGPPH